MRSIKEYEVIRQIGKGAFGKVFLVEKDGIQYALKGNG